MGEGRPNRPPRGVAVLAGLLLVGVVVSVVAVLPGMRPTTGWDPVLDGWVKVLTYLLVAVLVAARAVLRVDDRVAWSWLAAGFVLHALGFAVQLGWVRWQDPVPAVSFADAAWLLSTPAFLVGLILLVRGRWPRRSRAVLLDALAAAAVAAAITTGTLSDAFRWTMPLASVDAVVALAYPLLDIAVITAVVALLAGLGARWRDPTILWLALSMVGMTAVDIIFAVQTATGTFRAGSPLSGLSVAATAAGAVAAWVPTRVRPVPDPLALPGLGVPASIAAGAIGVLLVATRLEIAVPSVFLATLGLLLLAGRVALTFRVAGEVGSLRRAQKVARLGSWVSDPEMVAQSWAQATVALLGSSPEGVDEGDDGRQLAELVVEDDREPVLDALQESKRSGEIDVTYRVRHPDGEVRTVRARAEADLDARGQPVGWVGTLQDVTEQHQLAAALAESEVMLRRVLTATNDGWWTMDMRTGDTLVSDRWWELHGYQPPFHGTTGPPWRDVTSPRSAAVLERELEKAVAEGLPSLSVTMVSQHRDGQDLPVRLRVLLEYDEAATPVRISAAATDLTAAQQAEAAKDALIAAVSHELRTPLTPIIGFSEFLRREGRLEVRQQQAVQAIERNAAHLVTLVDGLITATRLHRRGEEPQPRMVDLTKHVAEVLLDLGVDEAKLDAPRAAVLAWVDPTHLTQILGNLLDNAANHGEPPIEVSVQATGSDRIVAVSDNGPGVPDWFTPVLFEDFAQATAGDQRPTLGLGLGLAIARRLAEANLGTLDYETTTDRTTFVLRLPAEPPQIGTVLEGS